MFRCLILFLVAITLLFTDLEARSNVRRQRPNLYDRNGRSANRQTEKRLQLYRACGAKLPICKVSADEVEELDEDLDEDFNDEEAG